MAITKGEYIVVVVAAIIGAAGSIVGAVFTGDQTVTQVFQGPQTSTVTVPSIAVTTTTALSTVTVTNSVTVTASPTSSTGAISVEQPDPEVRHQGPLTLISGNSATDTDLDAPQSDAQWGRESNTGDASGDAPYISGSTITTGRVGVTLKLMKDDEVNYATCAALGEIKGNQIAIGELKVGSNICSKTTAQRWARLTIIGEPSGDQIDFDVTVWEPH